MSASQKAERASTRIKTDAPKRISHSGAPRCGFAFCMTKDDTCRCVARFPMHGGVKANEPSSARRSAIQRHSFGLFDGTGRTERCEPVTPQFVLKLQGL